MVKLWTNKLMTSKHNRNDRDTLIRMLRYYNKDPDTMSKVYASYKSIAKLLKVSYELVRKVCIKAITSGHGEDAQNDTSKILSQEHFGFLTRDDTLRRWAGLSLDERAASFKNAFPNKELTGGRLYHIYIKHRIRYKMIR